MIYGAVLTGGRSSRFGRDKCAELFHGKPLVQIAFEKLHEVVENVYIVGKDYGIGPHIPDIYKYLGPLNALYSFFNQVSDADGVIVLPCDTPLVPVELLKFMARQSADIVVPEHAGYYEPLIGFYSRKCLPLIKELLDRKQLSMKNLIEHPGLNVKIIDEGILHQFGDPSKYFLNINYPEDMEKLRHDIN